MAAPGFLFGSCEAENEDRECDSDNANCGVCLPFHDVKIRVVFRLDRLRTMRPKRRVS